MPESETKKKSLNTGEVVQKTSPKDDSEKNVVLPKDYELPEVAKLFENDVVCVTTSEGVLPVKEEMRNLIALFSDGKFFVCESYKFDGRVLNFEVLARKRHLKVNSPEYVPMAVINLIYKQAKQNNNPDTFISASELDQVKMQKEFVTIVAKASAKHVSDIHIVVADHTSIMFRTNGLMQTEMEYDKTWGESFVRAIFASSDISDANYSQNEYQAAQKLGKTPLRGSHGKLMLPRNVLGIRLQFNPIAFGSRYVVLRLLYADEDTANAGDLHSLGYTDTEAKIFERLRAVPVGIVIVSGPTGSGKSTTLQRNMISMLKERNYEINLITVEDPPEYPIPGARQMPVTNAPTEELKDREFTKALAASLRSDPDMLMIGEIRTLSAANLAFKGALSGHGVWTTLHANSAPATLLRLRDMGVEHFKLLDPELIKGLLAQRLFRRVCPKCRVPVSKRLDLPVVQRLKSALGDFGMEQSYLRGPGCPYCDFKGVKGRTSIGELLVPDATFLHLMGKGENKKAIDYWTGDLGGRTLKDCALERLMKGIVDAEEVERWCGLLDERPVY
ncbi:MAG: ATPase, T2SS/T4P/T4SS family [Alphaproteobacteria bacterium]|nr:ATPase, T2SS/T4P/T4SS family [Alphaproteobacteria bacterium]